MKLADSGNRRQFDTGAVRDIAEGKGRCDLVPLDVIAHRLKSPVLYEIYDFIADGDYDHLYNALDYFMGVDQGSTGEKAMRTWADFTLEVSKHYEDGCNKYGERNWEQGIPVHCFIDSGVRHFLKILRGDTDEPHDRAFVWNMLGAIWTVVNKPELCDVPGYPKLNKEDTNEQDR